MPWQTHEVVNQVDELRDYNLFMTDASLREAVQRGVDADAVLSLVDYGERIGSSESFELAAACDRHPPELVGFDARGRRIDTVEFHPAWHALMSLYRGQGLAASPFSTDRPGRWSAFAAGFYLHGQVEAGTLCPGTMTLASIPVLQDEAGLFALLRDKLYSTRHDPRDLPAEQKDSIWLGMGMTEKQGGSDVRSNTTRAVASGVGGRGAEYLLTGHKWFFSAPMCDAHLVVAQAEAGPACFYVPRWRPDATRNSVRLRRLKDKVGNRSNASAEVEFEQAWGIQIGEDGRGIPTIIEMATHTRLCCVIGSAALMRQAVVQALHNARHRHAFGRLLIDQPLMRSVLADMALESEAATALMMRLALAFEGGGDAPQRPWRRVMTPAAQFWVCKRAVELTGEAMEVLGGNGYVETGSLARLYREAPVNSIWEGSGNVMCLDMLRAIAREPDAAHALLDELQAAAGDERVIRAELDSLSSLLDAPADEAGARRLCQRLVLVAQAVLLRQYAPSVVADAFIATRLDAQHGRVYGAIDAGSINAEDILNRAWQA